MTDKVRKVFDLLGIEPNEEFKVKDGVGNYWSERYFLDENLDAWFTNKKGEKEYFSETLVLRFLKNSYEIIKLPKKKKLRDITPEEYEEWTKKNCYKNSTCKQCLFFYVCCGWNSNDKYCWVNHKDLYSDKFLDREVEVE